MSGRLQARIREVLRAAPDGMTVPEINNALHLPPSHRHTQVYSSIKRMPDVYIDRWTSFPVAAVYVAVEVPPNCPKPEKRRA